MPKGIYLHKKGYKRPPFSEEWRKNIGQGHKGFKHSVKTIRKMKEGKLGERNSFYGKHHSQKTRKKIGEAHSGEKASNWQGGISFEPYSVDWTETLKGSIRQRDKYTCRVCGSEPAVYCHHIDYNKKNCNPDNLITLCNSCHMKTNFNRDYWLNYLK